jgi:hypothetical protein
MITYRWTLRNTQWYVFVCFYAYFLSPHSILCLHSFLFLSVWPFPFLIPQQSLDRRKLILLKKMAIMSELVKPWNNKFKIFSLSFLLLAYWRKRTNQFLRQSYLWFNRQKWSCETIAMSTSFKHVDASIWNYQFDICHWRFFGIYLLFYIRMSMRHFFNWKIVEIVLMIRQPRSSNHFSRIPTQITSDFVGIRQNMAGIRSGCTQFRSYPTIGIRLKGFR